MLRYNKCPTDKSGSGYKGKKYVHDEETILCYFCGKVGHMTSKCRHLRKTRSSNAFRINKKGPKNIWIPKEKIIPIFNHNKDTPTMVLWHWLLMSHDKRKVYVPMPNSHAWWNNQFRRKSEGEDSRPSKISIKKGEPLR